MGGVKDSLDKSQIFQFVGKSLFFWRKKKKKTESLWKCFIPEFSAEYKLSRGTEIGSLATCISTRISDLQDCSRDFIKSLVLGQITQEDSARSEASHLHGAWL